MLRGHVNVAIFLQNHFINWLAPYLSVSVTPLLEMSKLFKYQKQTVEDNLVRKGSRLPKIKGRRMTAEYIRCYQKRRRVLLSARMARPFLADPQHTVDVAGERNRTSLCRKWRHLEQYKGTCKNVSPGALRVTKPMNLILGQWQGRPILEVDKHYKVKGKISH